MYLFVLLAGSISAQPATISEESISLNTYMFSDPDPVPHNKVMYPYFRFDGYQSDGVMNEWNMVVLENEYIKVFVSPDVGGKVWGAVDKKTGKEFVYFNHAVKFREIAMRGAWTSGGIEFNFGIIGHAPSCSTPVDYFTRENEDGSVSCFVGATDLPSQTRWTVEIRLPSDKAYFITKSTWRNSSPMIQSYYHWTNGGFKADGNLEFVYPGTHYIGHDGNAHKWPTAENGKKINFYKENAFGSYKSYHVLGGYTDFFGGYWHDDDFGTVHYSPYDEKPGKKIWVWGLSRQGMIWEDLLTDTDGQYVELQSGRLFNQAAPSSTQTPFKHRGFRPGVVEDWTEYWFPVSGTKGFNIATPHAVGNFSVENEEIRMTLYGVQEIDDTIKVMDGSNALFSQSVSLKPTETWSGSVNFNGNADDLEIQLGGSKLQYSFKNETDLSRPLSAAEFDWETTYGLYLKAREWFYQRQYASAKKEIITCLEQDPNFPPALSLAAWIAWYQMDYPKAFDYARKALSINAYDAEANFIYALSSVELGNLADARDGFSLAAADPGWKPAALMERAKLEMKEGNFDRAESYARKCREVMPASAEASLILAMTARLKNDLNEAISIVDEIIEDDPLFHSARFEKLLLSRQKSDMESFRENIKNELPYESYLETAHFYIQCGQYRDALKVLSLSLEDPVKSYWSAWLVSKMGEDELVDSYLDQAMDGNPSLVFPHRSFSAKVLQWANTKRQHWKNDYYLAAIEWSRENAEEARKLLIRSYGTTTYAPYFLMLEKLENDPEEKIKYVQKARDLDSDTWRSSLRLAQLHYQNKEYRKAYDITEDLRKRFPGYSTINLLNIKSLIGIEKYEEAISLLENTVFLPSEGSREVRSVFREACMNYGIRLMAENRYDEALKYFGKAGTWPENLGAGKPYNPDVRLELYLQARSFDQLKQKRKANDLYRRIILSQVDNPHPSNTLIEALAKKRLNGKAEGDAVMQSWRNNSADDKVYQFSQAVYDGNEFPEEEALWKDQDMQRDPSLQIIIDLWKRGLI